MSDLINLFCTLAKIPSPSMREDAVAEKIMSFFTENGIDCRRDETGNVYARVPATDSAKKPVMLSAHMDVVGDDRPVHIVEKDGFIETDKTRTLGADDKAGVSCAMMLAKETAADKTLKHGGLEIVFTRDEEQNMTGARNIEYKTLESEHILVLDGDRLGELQIAGAGYTKMTLSVTGTKGGHSGIDIADASRVTIASNEVAGSLQAGRNSVLTMGISEEDLLARARRVFEDLIAQELNARHALVEDTPRVLLDALSRALAVLRSARLIAPGELLDLLSPIRLAASMGFLTGITRAEILKLMRKQLNTPELPPSQTTEDDRRRDDRDAHLADFAHARFADVALSPLAETYLGSPSAPHDI